MNTEGDDAVGRREGPATLGEAIARHANARPGAPALVATGFETLTYGELLTHMETWAAQLRGSGLDRHARIAIALPGAPAALAIVATAACAVAAPLDTHLTAPELDRRMAALRPAAVVVPADGPSPARQVAAGHGIPILEALPSGPRRLSLALAAAVGDAPGPGEAPDAAATAFILQTSGTTAEPKLIPFSHGNMLAAVARVQKWFGLTPADRCLCVSPVYYAHGLHVSVFASLVTGGSVAFPLSATTLDVDEWLVTLKPTWYSASPTLHRFMLDKTKALPDARSLHSLRFVVSGGAVLPPALGEDLAATLGVPVLEHYGSSEAAQVSANALPPGAAKAGTLGIPPRGTLKLVGERGEALDAGEIGEIWLGGPSVTAGYLDAAELNREGFVGGWFRTGDLGRLDAEGFLTLHGRTSELINRGGEKISPAEVDEALLLHPDVADAASFALPHPRLGEEVAAAVVLKPGAALTTLALRETLRPRLALFKIPRRVFFVDSLPKGPTGKVQRQRLAEQLK